MNDAEIIATYGGTISHGTMRAADLLDVLPDVLATIDADRDARYRAEHHEALTLHNLVQSGFAEATDKGAEALDEAVTAVFDALGDVAPEGYYFGAIEGDGSDYGFWAVEDEGVMA